MSAIFEMPINSEMLGQDEIVQITGCSRKGDQINWLSKNGWTFHENKAGEAIVGRLYARLRMAGISTSSMQSIGGWSPNFSGIGK